MMKIVFCDGVFDLFHTGHLKHFEKIHKYFNEPIKLKVGLINDKVATNYKRKPIYNEKKRYDILSSIKYINDVILMDDLIITEEFIKLHNIDYIFHAF